MGRNRRNQLPEEFNISLLDLIVLYFNVIKAKDNPNIGYENIDETYTSFLRRIKEQRVVINRKDLEAALWASGALDEEKEFWHPTRQPFKRFITAAIQHRQLQFYFDRFYTKFVSKKPRTEDADREIYSSSADGDSL